VAMVRFHKRHVGGHHIEQDDEGLPPNPPLPPPHKLSVPCLKMRATDNIAGVQSMGKAAINLNNADQRGGTSAACEPEEAPSSAHRRMQVDGTRWGRAWLRSRRRASKPVSSDADYEKMETRNLLRLSDEGSRVCVGRTMENRSRRVVDVGRHAARRRTEIDL